MAILESCCGCSLAVSSAVLGVYLLVAYAIAFAIELWWVLESPATPPIPAYLLCLGYFILLTFSALLLHGLSVKRTTFLLIWLFMMGVLLGPEAGLVLYLSIHYWKVTSLYGLIEITCWACRLVVNSIGLLCVQSLHSIWREEKSLLLRLETLKTSPLPKAPGQPFTMLRGYKNACYEKDDLSAKSRQDKPNSVPPKPPAMYCKGDEADFNYIDARYADGSEFSEFNASSFDPTVIDAGLANLPYLTLRKKSSPTANGLEIVPKTRSLLDFRITDDDDDDEDDDEDRRDTRRRRPGSPRPPRKDLTGNRESDTNSLDRKIIKNKNLKILRSLSPFSRRKPVEEMNVYQINPPKESDASGLDSQLNRVFSTRGRYAFDEKIKKVVYYPPEFFGKSPTTATNNFRKRMDSYASSQSRSSVDTDSEDLRHISDVAL